MPEDKLNEREFELVNIVGAKIASNQRDLSRHLDLSLGLTNMLLRRLVVKGYIRIRQLNNRKVEYMLTPKGFAEKMRKSIKYTVKTINSIGMIRARLKETLSSLYEKGDRKFVILGQSDLAVLVEGVLKEVGEGNEVSRLSEPPSGPIEGVLLICKENYQARSNLPKNDLDQAEQSSIVPTSSKSHLGKLARNGKSINLIQELAKTHIF